MAQAPKTPKAPAKTAPRRGRKSDFSQEIANEICAQLTEGKSLAEICRGTGMPVQRTIFRWLAADKQFSHDYARARESQADADADSIGHIAAQVLAGMVDPTAARVAIDALKWTAAKRKPLVYGDSQRIDLTASIETKDDKELMHELEQAASSLGLSVAQLVKTLPST